jgi:hypothetical protein
MMFSVTSAISPELFVSLKATKPIRRIFFKKPIDVLKPSELNRNIYMFWDKGIENAPEICRLCVESWRILNPQWSLVLLDEESAKDIVDRSSLPKNLATAHYADILRTKLLRKHGGVWADATVLCLKPLDSWLPLVLNQSDLFAFHRPARDRVISSWFLAASCGSNLMSGWDDLVEGYWLNREAPPPTYFWYHFLFEYLISFSVHERREWAKVPKISAVPLHVAQRGMEKKGLSNTERRIVSYTPMQKLTYRTDLSRSDLVSMLGDLLHPEIR